jgi:hypothetical protein
MNSCICILWNAIAFEVEVKVASYWAAAPRLMMMMMMMMMMMNNSLYYRVHPSVM